jgi:hypothetical protein
MDPKPSGATIVFGSPSLPASSNSPSTAVPNSWAFAVNVKEVVMNLFNLEKLGVGFKPRNNFKG